MTGFNAFMSFIIEFLGLPLFGWLVAPALMLFYISVFFQLVDGD